MPHIRRFTAGSDSFGNTWENSGDVVEVTAEQALALLEIPDFDGVEVLPDELEDEKPAKTARKTASKD
jgi:hypothetical protein